MRLSPTVTACGGVLLGVLAASAVARGAPPPPAPPAPPPPGPARYEYAVRCVFRGPETQVLANYKLRCNELGTEIVVCPPLELESCRLKVINEMGLQGWKFIGADETGGLGPVNSVTFERQVSSLVVP